jgi:flagellar FliJ protein
MRRFHFSLDGLLRVREYHEHQRELELGRATARYEQVLSQMRALEAERRETAFGMSGTDLSARASQSHYLALIEQTLEELEERRRELEAARNQALQEYTDAHKERKVIDNLRERRSREHYRNEARHADRELNEIGSVRAAMRRHEEEQNG